MHAGSFQEINLAQPTVSQPQHDDIWAKKFFDVGDGIMHCRMFSSSRGLSQHPSPQDQKCPQTLPGVPWGQNHWIESPWSSLPRKCRLLQLSSGFHGGHVPLKPQLCHLGKLLNLLNLGFLI